MIRNNDEYAVWAYEMGFNHAMSGIKKSATCCREYALGYEAYEATK